MASSAILKVKVIGDAKSATTALKQSQTSVEKLQSTLDNMTPYAAGVIGGLAAIGKEAFDQASELEQSTGAIEAVFKSSADAMKQWAAGASTSVGLSTSEAQNLATILGAQLKNMGVAQKEVAGQTQDLVGLGADLAAQFGGTTSDAVSALSSLLRGERDPIEKYGVSINQAAVDAKMAEMGLSGLSGEAKKNAELQATLALLTTQTSDAQGAFARETDTAAHAQQVATAQWKDAAAKLGTALLPAVVAVSGGLSTLATWVSDNSSLVLTLLGVVGGLAASILTLNGTLRTITTIKTIWTSAATGATTLVSALGRVRDGFQSAQVAQSAFSGAAGTLGGVLNTVWTSLKNVAVATATWTLNLIKNTAQIIAQKAAQLASAAAGKIAAAAQWVWNAALSANPLGIIIIAITAVIAAIVLLITHWDSVKKAALAVWSAISAGAKTAWAGVKSFGSWLSSGFKSAWAGVKSFTSTTWNSVKSAGNAAWSGVKSFSSWLSSGFKSAWAGVKSFGRGAFNGIKSAGSTLWGWIKQLLAGPLAALKSIWSGIRSAAKSAIGSIIGWVKKLVGWVKSATSWVKSLFSASGSQEATVYRARTNYSLERVQFAATPIETALGTLTGAATRATAPVYNITVNGALDPVAVADQIKAILKRRDRQLGGRR